MNTKSWTKEELIELYDNAVQQLGEMQAEAANETAQFGDSGPGSAIEIREQAEYVGSLLSQLAKLSTGEPNATSTSTTS